MDGYQFTAAILQSLTSLAWPAAIVVCVSLFREKLTSLLPFLRMKYKDFDISFRLEKAEEEAKALPPMAKNVINIGTTPEEKTRFDQLAEIAPRAAILETRLEIEDAVVSAAKLTGASNGLAPLTLMVAIRSLRNSHNIDAHTSALLDDLRAIGNSAAHQNSAQFSTQDALRFRDLANSAIKQLSMVKPKQTIE